MKILAIVKKSPSGKADSAIDTWRIKRPMLALKEHTDWQIDFQESLVRNIKQYDDPDEFMREHATEEVKHLGQYDIIYTSYFTSPHLYTLLWAAEKEYGTKYIIDMDDDFYDVDPENPFWLAAGWEGAHFLRTIGEIAPRLTTTNKDLAMKLRRRSEVKADVRVLPNYISDDYKEYNPANQCIRIGYFGGASHYNDLHDTGVLHAVKKIMEEHPEVRFRCVGQPIDIEMPEGRVDSLDVAEGDAWARERIPQLHYDISLGPLRETEFNNHKSNIKWQESTRIGAAFVCTNYGPYRRLRDGVAWKVSNTREAWYLALKTLVEDEKKRKRMVSRAREALEGLTLEKNWHKYKELMESCAQS